MTTAQGSDGPGSAEGSSYPVGIDGEHVTEWFAAHVPHVEPPLTFSLITGGHSNLTFEVRDGGSGHWVLRRPPLGHVLATAHDMRREHRIISALAPTAIPVAPAVGLCTDEGVNGAPFYVMEFVEGRVVRDIATAAALTDTERRTAGESLVDVLADIHEIDVDAVGIGDLGRREAYIERQLNRWYKQFLQSKTREVPLVDAVHDHLLANVPEQGAASIVHGDYRLDNCMLGTDARVAAVLDWEICTLGDPLADLGLLWVYWGAPTDAGPTGVFSPTTLDGFPTREELADRYASRSGRDISLLGFYVAFGYWKLACILDGVYARYVAGAMGSQGDASAFQGFADTVDRLAEAAHDAARDGA